MALESFSTDTAIVLQVAKGDEVAFTTLFHRHRDRIYSAALAIAHDVNLAEEIVADVFLIVWERRERLVEIENFEAYLFTIARNKTYHVLKDIAKKFQSVGLDTIEQLAAGNNAEDILTEKENTSFLNTAMEKLPAQQKKVYQLIKIEQKKRDEVAEILHLHPETIKFHLAQAVKNMRRYCAHYLEMLAGFGIFLLS